MSKFRGKPPLLATTAILLLSSHPALAQPADGPRQTIEADGESTSIAEVVVTARRRLESQQSTPITLTTFSGEELEEKGISEPTKLVQVTPGLGFDEFPPGQPRLRFRGVGSGEVTFLDGIYLDRQSMLNLDFYDLERVEVLKGPQGTLYGKNSVSGAINFITAKPTDVVEASAQATVGEFGQKNANLMVNTPITEALATRLVLGVVHNDGFRHTVDGRPLDNQNKFSGRLHVRATLGDQSSLMLSGDYMDVDESDSSRFNVQPLGFVPGKGRPDYKDPRTTDSDFAGFSRVKHGGVRGEFSTDALGFANWTVLAGWRRTNFGTQSDLDASNPARLAAMGWPITGIETFLTDKATSWSGETRLTSRGEGPLNWVVGAFYNHNEFYHERESPQQAVPTTINNFITQSDNDNHSVFGEAEYAFDFGLKVFAGARYTKEHTIFNAKRLTGSRAAPTVSYDTANAMLSPGGPGRFEGDEITYRYGANWRINDQVFVFGSVSTGFKSPAFQEQPSTAFLARQPNPPEKATNYEAGLKTDWFARRLRVNLSAFYMDYYDLLTGKTVPDLSACPTCTRFIQDSADAEIKGLETEFIVAPVPWFDATVRYTYLRPFFTKFIQTSSIQANGIPLFSDGAGNRLSRTPITAVTVDAGLQSSRRASWGWVRGEVSADYQSDIFDNNINDYVEYRKARTLWDASLTYHINDRYSAQLWGHNLTNESYRTWQTSNTQVPYHMVQYGPPRQFGVTLSAAFQ